MIDAETNGCRAQVMLCRKFARNVKARIGIRRAKRMSKRTLKFRLYPTKAQVEVLNSQLGEACRLYNAALQERRDAWRINRKAVNYYEQQNQLPAIRANGDIGLPNAGCAQDVLRRLDKAFKAFFGRLKRKEKAGFPRFKSFKRYDSITYKAYGDGVRIVDGKLRVQGIGHIKLRLHREINEKEIKTITIKREADRWFVCFSVETNIEKLPKCEKAIGLDVGISSFVTLSDGQEIANLRHYEKAQNKLRIAQRRVMRRKKGSKRRRKAVVILQRAHAKITNCRKDFHHKTAREIVNNYGLIVAEDLNIKGLASSALAKQVRDVAWGKFLDIIAYKAEDAGREFMKINPNFTSQTCSSCGNIKKKKLSERWHNCEVCSLSIGRDHNAAIEILGRGTRLHALT